MKIQILFAFCNARKWSSTGDSLTKGQRKRAKLIRKVENEAYDDRSIFLDIISNERERSKSTAMSERGGKSLCSLRKKSSNQISLHGSMSKILIVKNEIINN